MKFAAAALAAAASLLLASPSQGQSTQAPFEPTMAPLCSTARSVKTYFLDSWSPDTLRTVTGPMWAHLDVVFVKRNVTTPSVTLTATASTSAVADRVEFRYTQTENGSPIQIEIYASADSDFEGNVTATPPPSPAPTGAPTRPSIFDDELFTDAAPASLSPLSSLLLPLSAAALASASGLSSTTSSALFASVTLGVLALSGSAEALGTGAADVDYSCTVHVRLEVALPEGAYEEVYRSRLQNDWTYSANSIVFVDALNPEALSGEEDGETFEAAASALFAPECDGGSEGACVESSVCQLVKGTGRPGKCSRFRSSASCCSSSSAAIEPPVLAGPACSGPHPNVTDGIGACVNIQRCNQVGGIVAQGLCAEFGYVACCAGNGITVLAASS